MAEVGGGVCLHPHLLVVLSCGGFYMVKILMAGMQAQMASVSSHGLMLALTMQVLDQAHHTNENQKLELDDQCLWELQGLLTQSDNMRPLLEP